MIDLLQTLYGYHAWANQELLGKLALLDPREAANERLNALRLVGHYHVVARIFAAHLTGTRHGYTSDSSVEAPDLDALGTAVAETDRWYRDYVAGVSAEALNEPVSFTFTDGDEGRMTRQEMLLHVALHSAIHRGEVCRILSQGGISPPWDTLAVHLHQTQPSRRSVQRVG